MPITVSLCWCTGLSKSSLSAHALSVFFQKTELKYRINPIKRPGGRYLELRGSKSATVKVALINSKKAMGILSEKAVLLFLSFFSVRINSLRKEFAPCGANSFLSE